MQSEGVGTQGVTGFLNNAHTAVTRRFKNIVTDDRTHSIFELILGTSGGNGESEASPSTSTAAGLSAEARELPIADDADSGSDGDCLADRPWPSRGTAMISPRDMSPARAAPPRRRAAPPSPPRLQPDLTSPQPSADMPPVEQLSMEDPGRAVSADEPEVAREAPAVADSSPARPSMWVSEPAISTSTASPRRPSRTGSGFQSPSRSRKGSMSELPMARQVAGGSNSVDAAGMDLLRFDDEDGAPVADGAMSAAAFDPFALGLAANATASASEAAGAGFVHDGGAVAAATTAGNPFAVGTGMGPGAKHNSAGRLSSFVEIAPVDPGDVGRKSPLENPDPFALPGGGVPVEGGGPGDPLL